MPETSPQIDLVFRDESTTSSLRNFSISENTANLFYEGEKKNVNLDLGEIEAALGHAVHPSVLDIYKVAFAVYMADLLFRRPPKTGGRSLSLLVSVSDKSKWDHQKDNLKALL